MFLIRLFSDGIDEPLFGLAIWLFNDVYAMRLADHLERAREMNAPQKPMLNITSGVDRFRSTPLLARMPSRPKI